MRITSGKSLRIGMLTDFDKNESKQNMVSDSFCSMNMKKIWIIPTIQYDCTTLALCEQLLGRVLLVAVAVRLMHETSNRGITHTMEPLANSPNLRIFPLS